MRIYMAMLPKIVLWMTFLAHLKAETYTRKWDNIDIDEILSNNRLLENYKKCLLDQGPCTEDGNELKRNIPEALQTDCMRCTKTQKVNTEKVINFFMENRKPWWEQLQKKYDPSGIYYKKRMDKKLIREQQTSEQDESELKCLK